MPLPLISASLLRRFELADAAYLAQRLCAGGQDVVGERFGDAVVFIRPDVPADYFNRIVNLDESGLGDLDRILELFASRSTSCRIDLTPETLTPTMADALLTRGFRPRRFVSVLYGSPRDVAHPAAGELEIVEVRDDQTFSPFIAVQQEAYGLPVEFRDPAPFRHWLQQEDWTMFLASRNGEPCAAAILRQETDLAYLAAAATAPSARGQGFHIELVRHRLRVAAGRGADIVFVQTDYGTTSQRNMERAGLQLACLKQIWTNSDGEGASRGAVVR